MINKLKNRKSGQSAQAGFIQLIIIVIVALLVMRYFGLTITGILDYFSLTWAGIFDWIKELFKSVI